MTGEPAGEPLRVAVVGAGACRDPGVRTAAGRRPAHRTAGVGRARRPRGPARSGAGVRHGRAPASAERPVGPLEFAARRPRRLRPPPLPVRGPTGGATSSFPRRLYGTYLTWALDRAAAAADGFATIRFRYSRVSGLEEVPPRAGRVRLSPAVGGALDADAVVLALGHLAPKTRWVPQALHESAHFAADPWRRGALDRVPPAPDVLLVGTGLTMCDVARTPIAPGHTPHAVSRTGRMPLPHAAVAPRGTPALRATPCRATSRCRAATSCTGRPAAGGSTGTGGPSSTNSARTCRRSGGGCPSPTASTSCP
jgi:hypothetical protein